MWILPKQLHTSAFVPDTEALISDSTEQSEICAQSLLARSKPSPARTWSQRWKRDSWTQHLSGRILKPSHGPSFVTAWISFRVDTLVSRSAQPASDSGPKTHDTSGRTYQPELLQCDQVSVSLKTSRDISALGYPTCCKTWQDWVTERRGAWRQRVNAARLTRGKESGSWPSVTTRDHHSQGSGNNQKSPSLATTLEKNWPTVTANEDSYRIGGESQQSKCLSAMARRGEMNQENWLTPQSGDVTGSTQDAVVMWANGQRPKTCDQRLRTQVAAEQLKHGQAAPASWPTPIQGDSHLASTPEAAARRLAEGKSTLSRLVESGQAAPASSSSLGTMAAWPTPNCMDVITPTRDLTQMESKGHWGKGMNTGKLSEMVNYGQAAPASSNTRGSRQGLSWATPATRDTQGKRGAAANARKGNPLDTLPNQMAVWATPRTPTGGPESAQRKQELGRTTSGGGDLASQASGKLSSQWVCTLMGLPMGWVSPSCPASVIKSWPRFVTGWLQATTAPTSCDSSGMALCQPSQSERSDFFLAS